MHIGLSCFQHSLLVAAQASARAEATAANAEASRLRKRLALTTSELQKMSERVLLGHVVMVCASVRAPVLNWSRRSFRSCQHKWQSSACIGGGDQTRGRACRCQKAPG
jgi:hypothetical protein